MTGIWLTFDMPDYFHHYMDDTYFTYVVTLTRNDETLGAFGERYVLFVSFPAVSPLFDVCPFGGYLAIM